MTVRNSAFSYLNSLTHHCVSPPARSPFIHKLGCSVFSRILIPLTVALSPVTLTIDLANAVFKRFTPESSQDRNPNLSRFFRSLFQHVVFTGVVAGITALAMKVTAIAIPFLFTAIIPVALPFLAAPASTLVAVSGLLSIAVPIAMAVLLLPVSYKIARFAANLMGSTNFSIFNGLRQSSIINSATATGTPIQQTPAIMPHNNIETSGTNNLWAEFNGILMLTEAQALDEAMRLSAEENVSSEPDHPEITQAPATATPSSDSTAKSTNVTNVTNVLNLTANTITNENNTKKYFNEDDILITHTTSYCAHLFFQLLLEKKDETLICLTESTSEAKENRINPREKVDDLNTQLSAFTEEEIDEFKEFLHKEKSNTWNQKTQKLWSDLLAIGLSISKLQEVKEHLKIYI